MKKVATYARVGCHGNSDAALMSQESKLRDYCEKQGYEICNTMRVIGTREQGFPMLLELLQNGKADGVDTILMTSTKKVIGSVTEIDALNKAFVESGLQLETLDGSHQALNVENLISLTLASALHDNEESFGYDLTDDGAIPNEEESEVVRYVFDKYVAYSDNPPDKLVQEVIEDYAARGATITASDAAKKVSGSRIIEAIDNEVKEQWPEAYQSMIDKRMHNEGLRAKRFSSEGAHSSEATEHSPLIPKEEWEEVQAAMAKKTEPPEETPGMDMSM